MKTATFTGLLDNYPNGFFYSTNENLTQVFVGNQWISVSNKLFSLKPFFAARIFSNEISCYLVKNGFSLGI